MTVSAIADIRLKKGMAAFVKSNYSLDKIYKSRISLEKNSKLTMAIPTNRPGHRATDLPDWGPTFTKRFQHSSSIHITYYLEFNLGQSKIISRDKLLNGNWYYIFSSLTKFILTILQIKIGTIWETLSKQFRKICCTIFNQISI